MNEQKGFTYIIKGWSDELEFAKGIVKLTKMKSSDSNPVIDVSIEEKSGLVVVKTYESIDTDLTEIMGSIEEKQDLLLVTIVHQDFIRHPYTPLFYANKLSLNQYHIFYDPVIKM